MLTFLFLALLPAGTSAPAATAQQLFQAGAKQFSAHQFEAARKSFQKVTELDSKNYQAYRALGMADLELKDYEAAYKAWLKAVAINPKDEKSTYFLGRLFYEANLADQAAAWLRQALKLDPNDFKARTYLGLCAQALGFDKTALQLYRKAVAGSEAQHKPYSEAYLSLANFLRKHGQEAEALLVLERGAKNRPEAHELSALGEVLARNGQKQRAEKALRQAIALDPKLAQAHYRLALLLRSMGQTEESQREMEAFRKNKTADEQAPKIIALRNQTQ